MVILSRLPYLPEDLIIEILLRLPVKSLLRFASVSREWHTIIRSPRFILNHVHRDNNITSYLVYLRGGVYDREIGVLVDVDDELALDQTYACLLFSVGTFERQELPDLPGPIIRMCGHCNGIFCVLFLNRTVALWNPATRKLRSLSRRPIQKPYDCSIGFGIDPLTGDIKVVFISNERYSYPHEVFIYCSRDDSWNFVEQEKAFLDPDSFVRYNGWINTFLNGFCYWIKGQWTSKKNSIIAFDIHNDTFQEIEMPHMLGMNVTLDIYDDTLALLAHQGYWERTIDIWLMNEPGCWTKHRTVPITCEGYYPIGVWDKNHFFGTVLCVELNIYDLDSETTTTLKLGITEAITSSFYPCPYKESLVLV